MNWSKIIKITYLSISSIIYLVISVVLNHFLARKMASTNHPFNPSIIEHVPESRYQIGIAVSSIAVVILLVILFGIIKHKKVANYFLAAAVAVQLLFTFFIGIILKDIEGVYFWKSAYVQKYFYFAGIIIVISLLVIGVWIRSVFNKNKKQ